MKRLISLLMALAIAAAAGTLVACGKKGDLDPPPTAEDDKKKKT